MKVKIEWKDGDKVRLYVKNFFSWKEVFSSDEPGEAMIYRDMIERKNKKIEAIKEELKYEKKNLKDLLNGDDTELYREEERRENSIFNKADSELLDELEI